MKARLFTITSIIVLLATVLFPANTPPAAAQTYTHDIIIYGAGFGGVAAALNAHRTYSDLNGVAPRILLINPQSVVGGLGALNGQNFWDWRRWDGDKVTASTYAQVTVNGISIDRQPQMGSHAKYSVGTPVNGKPQFDQIYATSEMTTYLNSQLSAKAGLTLLQAHDVKTVSRDAAGRITSVNVQKLKRENQAWLFDPAFAVATYTAPIFIDASENARLTRLAGLTTTLGRQDRNSDNRQMVASLMFRVKGINKNQLVGQPGWGLINDKNGHVGFWGGNTEIAAAVNAAAGTTLYPLGQFNKNNARYQIKGMNVAEDRTSAALAPASELDRVYWVNTLLIVGVDGNCERKDGCADEGATAYPTDGLKPWSADYAFTQARTTLSTPAFLSAMQAFPGFAGMQLMTVTAGGVTYPSVGESLYLRETIHTPLSASGPFTDASFALTAAEITGAGSTSATGSDESNKANRIGLGYYWMDSNGYTKANPASGQTDPDPVAATLLNPVYVPVDALLTNQAPNLIVAGYSANISSRAWTMMRVLPNLTVLGDGAGVLAGYARSYQADPLSFASNASWMTNVRNRIVLYGGRVDK
jgi:hypothetical protein